MRTRTLLLSSLIALALFVGGCASDKQVIAQADQMNTQLKPATLSDPELSNYLQKVGDRIIGSAKELDSQGYGPSSHKKGDNAWMFGKNMEFHFVNSKTVNAFTTGGDHMYVYNALFQMCKDEEELAAVMAHEYGHVYARHVAKGMDRQYMGIGVAAATAAGGYLLGGKDNGAQYAAIGFAAGGAGAAFLNNGFTRGDEAEADHLGFDFYTHAGWDPNQFGSFFQDMINAGYDKTPAIMSDHPTLASRVEAAKKWAKELPPSAQSWRKPPIADASQFKQLQARAAQLSKTQPDDTKLANSQQLLQALPRSCVVPYTTQDELNARKAIVAQDADQKKKKKKEASAQPAS